MNILVFEFVTGGGFLSLPEAPLPRGTLLTEGLAMSAALVRDLNAAHYCTVQLLDGRLREELTGKIHPDGARCRVSDQAELESALQKFARVTDAAILIAPETGGILQRTARQMRALGIDVLGGSDLTLERFGSKTATQDWLHEIGVRTDGGFSTTSRPAGPLNFPIVIKPDDGAGSEDALLALSPDQLADVDWKSGRRWRVAPYHEGTSASVALIVGPNQHVILQPCLQNIDPNRGFAFTGGKVLPNGELADRIRKIAKKVLSGIPEDAGYVGVDLLLGAAKNGSEDVVLEINPRLTTSYVGLSAAADFNLGQILVEIALGQDVPGRLTFSGTPQLFSSTGELL